MNNNIYMNTSPRKFYTIKQISQKHPAFTESSLRYWASNSVNNGFKQCMVRVGKRKIYIDEEAFFVWLEKQNLSWLDEDSKSNGIALEL